jgi:hypothetical protein
VSVAAKPVLDKIEQLMRDRTIGRPELLDALEEIREDLDLRIDGLRVELDDEEAP